MQSKVFKNKIILQILDHYKSVWALSRLSAVAHWDLETYMPPKGAGPRGEMLARVTAVKQKIFLDHKFVALIHNAEKEKNLNDYEKAVVRILLRDLKFYEKLPGEFLQEFEKLTNTGTVVWREAKDNNKYELFEPYLTKIFDMNRRMADFLGYKDSPYDALLDQFEEGLTVDKVEPFFTEIRQPLKDLLGRIVGSKKYSEYKDVRPLQNLKYDKGKMIALNEKVLASFWPGFGQNFRLDISNHPFTTSFSRHDTRITTWYQPKSFGESMLATVHEFGHALYDLQCDEDLEMTPIQGGSSLVIHESQSRFWENFIGRSPEFIERFLVDFRKLLSEDVQGTTLYTYFNKVAPGTLRVEADEVTYHFHIMIRFEIEKGLIEGRFKARDLREIWNEKMREYLGIVPKRDSDGVLQDVHWSMGSVGYFPTYSMGTFLSAQWASEISKSVNMRITNIAKIQKWLGDHIHRYGSTYTLAELLKKNGMKFDPKVNLKYLEGKYSKIYGF